MEDEEKNWRLREIFWRFCNRLVYSPTPLTKLELEKLIADAPHSSVSGQEPPAALSDEQFAILMGATPTESAEEE